MSLKEKYLPSSKGESKEKKEANTLLIQILQEIKESTQSDEASQELIKAMQNDFANSSLHSSIKHFRKMKDQLSVEDGLILLDSYKIVIPQAKRREILAKLHSSHQALRRTKEELDKQFTGLELTATYKMLLKPAMHAKKPPKPTTRTVDVRSTNVTTIRRRFR